MSRETTDYAEEDENPCYAEDDEIRKASISSDLQRKAERLGSPSPWREKSNGRGTRAEELHKDLVNLKNSRSRSSHEASVKEFSFENFHVLPRVDVETVSNTHYARDDEKIIRRASDFQDQADPPKELIERPTILRQVDHHSHDHSAMSPNSVPLASRSSSNASSKEGDGDKQPPPNRSPPDGVASSQAEGQLCFPSLAKICLLISAELCLTAALIRYNTGTSLSEVAKTLLFAAKLLCFAGFLLCLGAYIVQRSRRASRLMTAMGCAATFCGLLSILGTLFAEDLMLWLIGALCVVPISAVCAFCI